MKMLTDQQQKWAAVVVLIVIPFLMVHLFPDSLNARLLSLLWVGLLFPLGLLCLVFFTKQPVRLRNYSNPVVEKRIEVGAKVFASIIALIFIWLLTIPVLTGAFRAYVLKDAFTTVEDHVSSRSTPILASGVYWNIKLDKMPNVGYTYLFPTIFNFEEKTYKFTLLPGTSIVVNAEQVGQ